MPERKLGKGLDALLAQDAHPAAVERGDELVELSIDSIIPNPNQPRKEFDPEELAALADSIAQNGIIQPVVVRRSGDSFELIAGERRWRASRQLGLRAIPAVIRGADDERILELSLVENIQRQDLNPIEKAKAFKELIETTGFTQEEVAQRLGRKRSSVANMIRLLELPQDIQDVVSRGTISMGHARALLALSGAQEQRRVCRRIVSEGLSVRQVENISTDTEKVIKTVKPAPVKSANVKDMEDRLRRTLGTRVSIVQGKKGRGRILIDYFTPEEFERLLQCLAGDTGF